MSYPDHAAQPTSEIEALLMRAQSDPEARDTFYAAVLDLDVFAVVFEFDQPPPDLPAGAVVFATLTMDDMPWVPFATSLEIFEAQFPGKTPVKLKGVDLLMNASPKNLLMNPGTDFEKAFSPDEVDYMLSLMARRDGGVSTVQLRQGTGMDLGEPKVYPKALVEKLGQFLPQLPVVQRAWIAQSRIQQEGASANLLLAIELDNDSDVGMDVVAAQLGALVSPLIPPRTAFDMMQVRPGDSGISGYFLNQAKPFYIAGEPQPEPAAAKKGFRRFFGL